MDARPQRPLRVLRTRNDENVAPATNMAKTIHQRNKSSPALSTIGLKAAPKRTAFAEITNAQPKAVKDDSMLNAKSGAQLAVKTFQPLPEKKTSTFNLRPSQRPLSVSSIRGLLTGSLISNNVVEPPSKQIVVDSKENIASKKILNKRSTTIFKDLPLDPVKGLEQIAEDQTSNEPPASSLLPPTRSVPPLDPPAAATIPMVEPIKEGPQIYYQNDVPLVAHMLQDEADTKTSSEDPEQALRSDGIFIDAAGNVRVYQEPTQWYAEPIRPVPIKPVHTVTAIGNNVYINQPPKHLPQLHSTIPQPPSVYHELSGQVEPEEYWDEEEENYEEEGYVTAHSYRSKGENTTGGATTVLFPHVNNRVKKELEEARQLVEATRSPEEVEDESYDTSMVAEYGEEIFEYMKSLEVKMLPNAHYMDNQHEIQWSMRAVLMDWLVQVHHRFNLLPETLFLCVNYIDRFLSCKVVSLGKLQLVGATAIFIAAKYEEINCPSVQEIVYMVDGGYNIDEILKAERFMLTMLQFELGWPGPMSFLRRISKADDYDLETRTLAKYFLEITLMDERFIGSPPSFAAAGAHCLARLMLHKGYWSPQHVHYSGYTYSQLFSLLALMVECCEEPQKHHGAVYNKYCDKRYKRASVFVETEMSRGFVLPRPSQTREHNPPQIIDFFSGKQPFTGFH